MTRLRIIKERFAALGFDMKLKRTNNWQEVTFLKGMWFPQLGSGNPVWSVLPSRLLKAGKSYEDPRRLYPIYRSIWRRMLKAFRIADVGEGLVEAGQLFLGDVANTYASFPRVPGLRAFVDRFQIYASGKSLKLPEWEIAPDPEEEIPELDEEKALEQLSLRYGVDPEAFRELEDLYRRVEPYTLLSHPLFLRMAEVDYN